MPIVHLVGQGVRKLERDKHEYNEYCARKSPVGSSLHAEGIVVALSPNYLKLGYSSGLIRGSETASNLLQ